MINSATTKAEQILSELLNEQDRKTLFSKGRSQERIDLIRQVIERLIVNAIPTPVVGKVLKLDSPAVQYHLRWLEKNGRISRPSKFAHWKWAKETSSPESPNVT